PVLDMVPSDVQGIDVVRKQLDLYRPQGKYDAQFTLTLKEDKPAEYQLNLSPETFSLLRDDKRLEFGKMQGQVQINPERVKLDGIKATFDTHSTLAIQGEIDLAAKPRATLALDAAGKQ